MAGDSLFVRLWPGIVRNEPPRLRELRRDNLAGLAGRVLEVGAGTNFPLYPAEVTEVVALEPEAGLRSQAATTDPRIELRSERLDEYDGAPFDAVVLSLVLCSLPDPGAAIAQIRRLMKPTGELRFLEHVAADGRILEGLQKGGGATVWPRLFGNCHTHRDAVGAIASGGLTVTAADGELLAPSWVPFPTSPVVLGRATL
ncbi:methyltransferase domain-containing protein [Nocardiopsis tropica]